MINTIIFFVRNQLYKGTLTCDRISKIIEHQGFKIINFKTHEDEILKELNLCNYAEDHLCFTYVNGNSKYIFIKSDITDYDKTVLLIHEEGHIYYEHFTSNPGLIHNTSAKNEHAANIFYLTILYMNKICRIISKIFIFILVICFIIFIIKSLSNKTEKSYIEPINYSQTQQYNNFNVTLNDEDIVFYTPKGEVYHLFRDCSYIKSKNNVIEGTIKQSGKERCCSECESRKNK